MGSFLDRFTQLEIPEDKRRVDWSFLDEPLSLPQPLPLGAPVLSCWMNGKLLTPADRAPNGDWILFYADRLALEEQGLAADLEARWLEAHKSDLERQAKLFLDRIPVEILRDRVDEALEILQLNAPRGDLLGGERLLRIHGKLYNLQTLQEYTRIFEKAIDPGFFRELQAMPATCTPEEMLAKIAGSLPLIHKKARSPLRNKMECARLSIGGVTHLPIYREPVGGLIDAHRKLLERKLKVDILKRHA